MTIQRQTRPFSLPGPGRIKPAACQKKERKARKERKWEMERGNKQTGSPSVLLWIALACLLIASPPVLAQEGREFAGFYALSDVIESGDVCLLTLHLQVFNFGAADVNYGTITLKDSLLLAASYGSYPAVFLPAGGFARLTADVLVPARLYQEWQQGGQPRLSLEFKAADGSPLWRRIELASLPLAEED
jgi:hypothetical protein